MSEKGEAMDLEKRLEREMTELGPLIQRRRQAEAEGVDPDFAAALRSRLLAAPMQDAMSEGPAVPMRRPRRHRRVGSTWILLAGAVAAILVAILLTHRPNSGPRIAVPPPNSPIPQPTQIVAMAVPSPSTGDLLRGYPLGGGGGGMLVPEVSVFDIPGMPYAGHLRLAPATPQPQPPVANAFRLVSPYAVASRIGGLARRLGIRATPKQATAGHVPWLVAVDGGVPPGPALHSIAVSLRTGELIYHDAPIAASRPTHARPIDSARAVAYARHWLTALGWPGAAMPLQAAVPLPQMFPPSAGVPWQLSLGWAGAGIAAVANATLWITPEGHVFEARVWPPVTHRGVVKIRNVAGAWQLIREGRVPLAVEGMADRQPVGGIAMLRHVTVVQVLVTNALHPDYLVPAYRFEGTAQLRGAAGIHRWYALVAAVGERRRA